MAIVSNKGKHINGVVIGQLCPHCGQALDQVIHDDGTVERICRNPKDTTRFHQRSRAYPQRGKRKE